MGWLLSSSTVVLLLLTLEVVLLINPASSASLKALLRHNETMQNGFRVTLQHVDAGKNLTKLERVMRGIKRGRSRLQRLNAMAPLKAVAPASDDSRVAAPVHAGLGEFLMKLSIGTPAESFSAILDTGSDLIWTQCKPCEDCFHQSTPIFDPKKSKTFSKLPCDSELCHALPSHKCTNDGCEYFYSYGDFSSTDGILGTETFTFEDQHNKVSVPKIGFGCGKDNQGSGFDQGAGLVGLGRGPLSLVSQLNEPKFSYCLTSIDDTGGASTLLMGSLASLDSTSSSSSSSSSSSKEANIKTTPLIKSPNPDQPTFYYLSLQGISVGDTRLPNIDKDTFALAGDGTGGLIIDSGTTLTYIPEDAFGALSQEFTSQMKLSKEDGLDTEGLELCFKLPEDNNEVEVPKLVFHFKDADLELPRENYILVDRDVGVMCLAMGSTGDMSVFGNYQQQNMLVFHDLVKETLSFVPTKCDQL